MCIRDSRYTGRNYDDETDKTTKTGRVVNSYVNFLPSILVKWDVDVYKRQEYNHHY